MAVAYFYSNVAVANAVGNSGGLAISGTSLYLASTPSGYPAQFPFKLRLEPRTSNEEIVKVTAGSGTAAQPWTVVRAWDGTTAAVHAAGTAVEHGMTQEDLALSRQHEASGSTSSPLPHGLPSSAWLASSVSAIQEVTLPNSSSAQVTFNAIPQTFNHLIIMLQAHSTETTADQTNISVTVNGDSGPHYSYVVTGISDFTGGGTLVQPVASYNAAQNNWPGVFRVAASQTINSFHPGTGIGFIPNYSGTTFDKSLIAFSGHGTATSKKISQIWVQAFYSPGTQGALTSLSFSMDGGNFNQGSFVGLYGLG